MKDTPENTPEDTGETPAIMDLRTRYEGVARFCPVCNKQTRSLADETGGYCTTCGHFMDREECPLKNWMTSYLRSS